MSSRVTRSSARQAAASQGGSSGQPPATTTSAPAGVLPNAPAAAAAFPWIPSSRPPPPPPPPAPASSSTSRKRKVPPASPPAATEPALTPNITRRTKRPKVAEPALPPIPQTIPPPPPPPALRRKKGRAAATMSSPEAPAGPSNPPEASSSTSSSRRSSRHKTNAVPPSESTASETTLARRSARKSKNPADQDVPMAGADDNEKQIAPPPPPPPPDNAADDDDSDDDEDDEAAPHYDGAEDDDPFGGFGGSGSAGHGLSTTLKSLSGMMSGLSGRLRENLANLRQADDPSVQLIALQDLSEILLVSNEDNLSGNFSADAFVKELVALMQPSPLTGEENPEIMLLACRCLANLMEALPSSIANVVYGGAVPVLCQKLLEISFIDLAEQALSTLEKISVEYPASIVREGGLTACLSYLEFFAHSTQRTAVTTAANCCRNIPEDSFPVIRDVMPTLLNVLGSNDQKVVEQASLCVSRIVESFKYQPSKLEELVSVDLLRAVLRLLVPGTTNLIGANIHTQFLRVLAITARASPRLSAELFKMNVVETLYQILTGVSPPSETHDLASKLDSVLIMQALIHRPREQIIETLNVVCELLPSMARPSDGPTSDVLDIPVAVVGPPEPRAAASSSSSGNRKKSSNEKRLELLDGCKDEVRRFALILFPTLTDAFSSTVNLSVRQKVLTAQLKMLSNLDEDILTEALKTVSYASFLASILSQQDHPSLVISALAATELLLSRLDNVYRYQLYREGVIAEITKLAQEPAQEPGSGAAGAKSSETETPGVTPAPPEQPRGSVDSADRSSNQDDSDDDDVDENENDEDDDEDDDDDDDDEGSHDSSDDEDQDDENEEADDHHADDMSGSPVSSRGSTMSIERPPRHFISDAVSMRSQIAEIAKKFLEKHETEKHSKSLKKKAQKILHSLQSLANELEAFYLDRTGNLSAEHGRDLFVKLSSYFDDDVLESVTSAELLGSGVVSVLERIFLNPDEDLANAARSTFIEVFLGNSAKTKSNRSNGVASTSSAPTAATPFSVMVHKLQDLLSRSEHFEVLTVHNNTYDGNRSSAASMLAKQIRLRLTADDDSDIPRAYRNVMVSIHAIATFKALDDYLRPRMSFSDRPRPARRGDITRALAAMASMGMSGLPPGAAAARSLAERTGAAAAAGGSPSSGSSSSNILPPPPPPMPPAGAPQPSGSRSSRKSKSKPPQPAQSEPPSTPGSQPSGSTGEKAVLRRSTRRSGAGTSAAETPRPARQPPADDESLQGALECADEKQLTDDESEMLGEGTPLGDFVRDLDDEMDDSPTPDPGAVNLEVQGGRITARKEDGTRVPTPSHGSSTPSGSRSLFAPAPAQSTPSGSSSSSRPMSYSAAIQSVPQDWHIEFSINGKVIPNETTIYRAVHSIAMSGSEEHAGRSIWSAVHSIKFRRAPGPPPAEPAAFSASFDSSMDTESCENRDDPPSLSKHPTTASILRLLNILHDLNANIDDVLVENNKNTAHLRVEPLSSFVNTKLTAKLNRQLEEPLIVASNCLPSWSEDLARLYPFLFPFETRHLFLQSTSFGYARSMSRWQNAQAAADENRRDRRDDRPFLGRLQRQKVRISRSKILESALKVMELYGASQSILEVEYFEEVGTGLGPTLEFYSTVSKEFSKKKLKLWREMDSNDSDEFVSAPNGLFPRPLSEDDLGTPNGERILQLFKMLGKFVARSMIDSRIIDINFNPIFFRIGDGTTGVKPSLGAVKMVDPGLARSLKHIKKFVLAKKEIDEDPNRTAAQKVADLENVTVDGSKIDDLCLDFTLPGYPEIELIPHGSQTRVTIDNVELYLEKVIDMTLGEGVRRQVDAFRAGFSQVFPYSALSAFTPDELVSLFGRVEEDWSLETLLDSIKADHGFNMDSKSVRNLLQTMSEMTPAERRDFLQFTTGSPKLPIGGFKSLTPMFTVVCKPSEPPYVSDDYLPSVMTCVNYLKLPDYSSIDILKKRLFTAIKEGQGAFHLS